MFALGAAGISLVFGPLRIVNFAQGDYLTFGAFAAVLVNIGWVADMIWSTLFALVATAALAVVARVRASGGRCVGAARRR